VRLGLLGCACPRRWAMEAAPLGRDNVDLIKKRIDAK
jgi:hypothetical protein